MEFPFRDAVSGPPRPSSTSRGNLLTMYIKGEEPEESPHSKSSGLSGLRDLLAGGTGPLFIFKSLFGTLLSDSSSPSLDAVFPHLRCFYPVSDSILVLSEHIHLLLDCLSGPQPQPLTDSMAENPKSPEKLFLSLLAPASLLLGFERKPSSSLVKSTPNLLVAVRHRAFHLPASMLLSGAS